MATRDKRALLATRDKRALKVTRAPAGGAFAASWLGNEGGAFVMTFAGSSSRQWLRATVEN